MQVLYERCAGLDVHKKTVVACVMLTLLGGQANRQVRTFATTTEGLLVQADTSQFRVDCLTMRSFAITNSDHIYGRVYLALADWLTSQQVSHVALESTGIYWRPVFNILEGAFSVILVNAQHMRAVPGRKVRREVA